MTSNKMYKHLQAIGNLYKTRINNPTHFIYFPEGCSQFRFSPIGVVISKTELRKWTWPFPQPKNYKELFDGLNRQDIPYRVYKTPKGK